MLSTVSSFLVLLVLPAAVTALCYSPMMHGFMPDVILPSVLGSGVHCPSPRVFDHFLCLCVDPRAMVQDRLPATEGRTALRLSSLLPSPSPSSSPFSSSIPFAPPFPKSGPHLVGLPDMHVLAGMEESWRRRTPFQQQQQHSSPVLMQDAKAPPPPPSQVVVPALNPFGSFNIPANSKMMALAEEKLKARKNTAARTYSSSRVRPILTMTAKERELLEKRRWREQLRREASSAAAAAAQMAAAAMSSSASAQSSSGAGAGRSGLELFMQDTLRRILYG